MGVGLRTKISHCTNSLLSQCDENKRYLRKTPDAIKSLCDRLMTEQDIPLQLDMLGTIFRLCPGKPKEQESFALRNFSKDLASLFLELKPTNFGSVSREFLKRARETNTGALFGWTLESPSISSTDTEMTFLNADGYFVDFNLRSINFSGKPGPGATVSTIAPALVLPYGNIQTWELTADEGHLCLTTSQGTIDISLEPYPVITGQIASTMEATLVTKACVLSTMDNGSSDLDHSPHGVSSPGFIQKQENTHNPNNLPSVACISANSRQNKTLDQSIVLPQLSQSLSSAPGTFSTPTNSRECVISQLDDPLRRVEPKNAIPSYGSPSRILRSFEGNLAVLPLPPINDPYENKENIPPFLLESRIPRSARRALEAPAHWLGHSSQSIEQSRGSHQSLPGRTGQMYSSSFIVTEPLAYHGNQPNKQQPPAGPKASRACDMPTSAASRSLKDRHHIPYGAPREYPAESHSITPGHDATPVPTGHRPIDTQDETIPYKRRKRSQVMLDAFHGIAELLLESQDRRDQRHVQALDQLFHSVEKNAWSALNSRLQEELGHLSKIAAQNTHSEMESCIQRLSVISDTL
ncbi:hypothetical protein EMPS_07644 [Entomortierella parvispora]|uniref:Uncharacterized protein n=1 Tax=Entomortierella parvispora TaxID=205924 RepID=A0A9P3HEU9_9FUNG|nr:hypothetical protein EMPS_07644 [Entomortierella parvispora]